jgi:lipoate-protein ligase A
VLKGLGAKAEFRGEADKLKTPNCFAGRACPDVVIEGKKVFGSAQRRKDAGVLQHGSLLLDIDRELWAKVFGPNLGEGFTSLAEHGLRPGYAALAVALKQAYARALGVEFSPWQGQAEKAPAA